MIASQSGDPTERLLQEIFQLAVDDVRYKNPTACTKNELQETKRTAEDFFKTKFYHELCDLFNLPSHRVAKLIISQKDTLVREEKKDELS
jgi:hypothetical protein